MKFGQRHFTQPDPKGGLQRDGGAPGAAGSAQGRPPSSVSCASSFRPSPRQGSPSVGEGSRGQGWGVARAEDWGSGAARGWGWGPGSGCPTSLGRREEPARLGEPACALGEAPDPRGGRIGSRVSAGTRSRPAGANPGPSLTVDTAASRAKEGPPAAHSDKGDVPPQLHTHQSRGPRLPHPASAPEPAVLGRSASQAGRRPRLPLPAPVS